MFLPLPSPLLMNNSALGLSDPGFSTTVVLLGMNGTNGSTTFTDESHAARGAATVGGSAQVSTTSPKFGTGCLLLNGTTDAIGYPDHTDWIFSGDATWEGWFSFAAGGIGGATQVLMSQWDASVNSRSWILQLTSTTLQFAVSATGSSTLTVNLTSTWTPTADTFYHIAIDRSGNTWRLYRDGTMLTSATQSLGTSNSTAAMRIGCSQTSGGTNANFMNGKVDEVRINNGHAYYASNGGYTVPTAAFPRS
jgi:hypothetical protein